MSAGGEFDFIRRYLAPLAGEGAFQLSDDGALTGAGPYCIASDMLIAGRHFRAEDPLKDAARKALRANLSDMAAMGAKPHAYLLSLALPHDLDETGLKMIAEGLKADQTRYGLGLLGGDTTRHDGALIFSVTMLGVPPESGLLRRNAAMTGQDVYVTGTIGDAGLGLKALTEGGLANAEPLIEAYRRPEPPVDFALRAAPLIAAAIDVSDGLLADLGHIAKTSGVKIDLDIADMPLSEAAAGWAASHADEAEARLSLAAMGDDYQLAFTAAPEMRELLLSAADQLDVRLTGIGRVETGEGLSVRHGGQTLSPKQFGFTHF